VPARSVPDDYQPEPNLVREGQPDFDDVAPGKWETGDPQEGRYPPRDHAIAANAFGTTAEEELEGESLDQKLAREMPDFDDPRQPDHRDVELVGESDAAEAYEDDEEQ
jgi:hypothetical protein